MEDDKFIDICLDNFKFLIRDYQFKNLKPKIDSQGINVIYKSKLSGVTIRLEPRENLVFVMLHRLKNNRIPPYPVFIKKETTLDTFYLDNLIDIRNASGRNVEIINRSRKNRNGDINLTETLKAYANVLKDVAKDVLNGDHAVFEELNRKVIHDILNKR